MISVHGHLMCEERGDEHDVCGGRAVEATVM